MRNQSRVVLRIGRKIRSFRPIANRSKLMIGPVMIEAGHDPPDHDQFFFRSVFDRHKNYFFKCINLMLIFFDLFSIDRLLIVIRSGSMHNTSQEAAALSSTTEIPPKLSVSTVAKMNINKRGNSFLPLEISIVL
jgi:hypothetical protein